MKKVFFIALLVIFSITSVQAQGALSAGAHVGIPTGDASEISGLNIGADISYLWDVADGFKAGITSGYTYFTGKTFSVGGTSFKSEGGGFIPIAGTARYDFSDQIFGAADLGYGVSTTSGGSGAFYYQPKVGYKADLLDIFAYYKGMSKDGFTLSAIGIGAAYHFN